MIILGIETSCDETACAILEKQQDRIQILSNVVASSASIQAKYGGIIPEQAAREQIKSITPVIETAINDSGQHTPSTKVKVNEIDAIAVTYGPGLIGSLLVGVETAKTLAIVWKKPLIPINHLLGHFYANWITNSVIPAKAGIYTNTKAHGSRTKSGMTDNKLPTFPCIGLLVSGGHTDLVLFTDHGKYKYLGGTRDDAAGECFDKCARLLGLPYPGGPEISALAKKGKDTYKLPRPMIDSKNFDFSFSGLKTAVANIVNRQQGTGYSKTNLAASIEAAIVDVLVEKTIRAAQVHKVSQIMVAGGVAANKKLVDRLQVTGNSKNIKIHVPSPELCTDNGAMIAAAAFFQKPIKSPLNLQADPNLALSS